MRDRILAVPSKVGALRPRGEPTNTFLRVLDDGLRSALEALADEGEDREIERLEQEGRAEESARVRRTT